MSSAIEATTTEGIPEQGEATGAEPQAGANSGQDERTVQERVREGGDFAFEQIQIRDTTISEQSNKIKEFEVVDPYIRAAGGPEQLLNYAAMGQQVKQVPGLEEFVQKSLAEGRVALPEVALPNDPEDEWMDDDTKKLRDSTNERFDEFEQRFNQLNATANAASVRSHENQISRNIDSVVEMFSGTEEGKEEALKLIHDRVSVAQQQAGSGNVSQQRMIEQLAGPEGEDVLQFMLMKEGLFKKWGAVLYGAGDPNTEETASVAVVRSTDGMHTNPSRPGTPLLPPLDKGPVTSNTFALVLRDIQRRRGRPS